MDFKAERVNGILTVKAISVKDDEGNITIHAPSPNRVAKLIQQEALKEYGIRNI